MFVADTLLIDALRHDEKVLDRILALDGRFAKFRKVLNDQRVASVLSLADVAHMLDVAAGALLDFANGEAPMKLQGAASEPPRSSQGSLEPIAETLDLRPEFERGIEPLMIVLDAISVLKPGTALMVEAPFHPMPLRRLLGGRGFESRAIQVSPEHWQVVFRRENSDAHGATR
jgi:uncharacterized protein (DUF2249 family)